MEYMIRNWVNWNWLSGDHIVEQHVHNLDVILWFTGKHPVSAVGFGGRQRRKTGDQYDNFSIDFTYDNGMHMQSMCRQIHGCKNNVSEFIAGTKGFSNCHDKIWDLDGKLIWEYPYEVDEDGKKIGVKNPYDQEHVDMITAIRTNMPINEAENTANATMMAIMGRITAYTGQEVSWEEMMSSSLAIGPSEYKFGSVDIPEIPPTPGMDMDEYKNKKKKS
jgi:predicted dehydrogenase